MVAFQLSATFSTMYPKVLVTPAKGFQPVKMVAPTQIPIKREAKTCLVIKHNTIATNGGNIEKIHNLLQFLLQQPR